MKAFYMKETRTLIIPPEMEAGLMCELRTRQAKFGDFGPLAGIKIVVEPCLSPEFGKNPVGLKLMHKRLGEFTQEEWWGIWFWSAVLGAALGRLACVGLIP